ncbi:hypothetical protein EDD21DRAFT_185725 [Dissophora ornata]|nr:hypothetical protein EDD21DRAFT_185725 [Dissophora ornata]
MQSNKTYACSIAGCDATFTVIFDWTQHVRKHAHAVMMSNNNQRPKTAQAPRAQAQAQPPPAPRTSSSVPTSSHPHLQQNASAITARASGAPRSFEVTSSSTTRKQVTPSASTPAPTTTASTAASVISSRILFAAPTTISSATPMLSSPRAALSKTPEILFAKGTWSAAPPSPARAASPTPAVLAKTTRSSAAPAISSSTTVSSSTPAISFIRVVPSTRVASLRKPTPLTTPTIPATSVTPAISTKEAIPPTSPTKTPSTPQGSPKIPTIPSSTSVAENGVLPAMSVLTTLGHRSTSDSSTSMDRLPTPSSETSAISLENGFRALPDIDIDIDIETWDDSDASEHYVDAPFLTEANEETREEEEEDQDESKTETILVCKLRDEVAKRAPSNGKATRSKGVALFSKDCTAVFDTEMDQIRHYLEHIVSFGPYLECPVKTCRMMVISESLMKEHNDQFHPWKRTKVTASVPSPSPAPSLSQTSSLDLLTQNQRKRTRSQSKVQETFDLDNITATGAKRIASTGGESKEGSREARSLQRASRKIAASLSSKEESDDSGDFQPQILGPFFTGRSTRE